MTRHEPITHIEHPTACSWCGKSPLSYYTRYAFCDHVLCSDCAQRSHREPPLCNWRRTDSVEKEAKS